MNQITIPRPPKNDWGYPILIGVIAFLIMLLMFSCTHTKDLQKKSIEVKSDSIAITTSTETTTGELTIKGDTLIETKPDDQIIDIEDGSMKLEVKDVKGKITARAIQKPKVVPVKIVKVTDSKIEVKRNEKDKDLSKHVENKWNFSLNYLWWLLLLMLIPIWKYRKFWV